jgi:anti-sigma factor RsiW
MNIADDMLEILIGKYIDGEITPSEQGMLDGAMEKDARIRELLEQLAELHGASAEAIGTVVLDSGKSAEEIIDLAWRGKKAVRAKIFSKGVLRFAAGLAAGLLIGFMIHHVLAGGLQEGSGETEPKVIAKDTADQIEAQRTAAPALRGDVIRNVDYFGFTDEDGGQWLVEGLRENMVRPAVYYGVL